MRGSLGESPLHVAAASGKPELVRVLLEFHMDPNAEDHIRETPLHWAAFTGHEACVDLLMLGGALPEMESFYSQTPLQVAEECAASFVYGSSMAAALRLKKRSL